jgi:hypothetical protein
VGGLLLARNTPMRDVFWAAVIPAIAATIAAAGIAWSARDSSPMRH